MIIDDSQAQLKLLAQWMQDLGYTPRPFPNGRLAIEAARVDPPDLILLDINMPEMDGYEVCRRVKESPQLRDIPIIFISASGDTSDKVEAFQTGGVDYVTKPFRLEEVSARVDTHLKLSRLQRELEQHNRSLEDLVRERTAELAEAHDRLSLLDRAKSDFLQLISHELRTPLNGVLGIADIILKKYGTDEKASRLGKAYQVARHNLLTIVDDALLLAEIDVSEKMSASEVVRIVDVIEEANSIARGVAESHEVQLAAPPPSEANFPADHELLVRALTALAETAVKLTTKGESVIWGITDQDRNISISLESRGRSVPEAVLSRFFEIFSVAEPIAPGGDLGLRHVVADRIVSLFGGSISVANQDPAGLRFLIEFPTGDGDSKG